LEKSVAFIDVTRNETKKTEEIAELGVVNVIKFSPDEKVVYCGGERRIAQIKVDSQELLRLYTVDMIVKQLNILPGAQDLSYCGFYDWNLFKAPIVDSSNKTPPQTLGLGLDPRTKTVIQNEDQSFFMVGAAGKVAKWDHRNNKLIKDYGKITGGGHSSFNGGYVAPESGELVL